MWFRLFKVREPPVCPTNTISTAKEILFTGAGGGVDHGEKQRPMALAAERMDGGGLEPSADSDGTRRPKAASNPHDHTVEGF